MSSLSIFVKPRTFMPPSTEAANNKLLEKKVTENNNQITNHDKTVQEVWSKYNFHNNNVKMEPVNNVLKTTWATDTIPIVTKSDDVESEREQQEVHVKVEETSCKMEKEEETSPSHHARRPMNAFLIFCKKHRPVVREKYPNLENRGVTRILGEWWALLDIADKAPYTTLAKEYKDAFLSANPDFKWYKLPAPPLRTLQVRPSNNDSVQKVQSPITSPSLLESEFTPGKLADESQLGSLTSLLNNNFNSTVTPNTTNKSNENNNNDDINGDQNYDTSFMSPVNLIKKPNLPPKPFKKRNFEDNSYPSRHSAVRNLMKNDISVDEPNDNMTNQDLMDKVVDKIFTAQEIDEENNGLKELVRKSGRQCKGKRYEKFMSEGRLLGNKRETFKLTSQRDLDKLEDFTKVDDKTETPNLDHTIKRLAERTNMKCLLDNQTEKTNDRLRISDNPTTNGNQTNFNLNSKINNLPSLSYDVYLQRKRDSKKRKPRSRTDLFDSKRAKTHQNEMQLVGSKKRKNKQSITHLEKQADGVEDLLALATLAEVAANTEKINN